jgi:membrane protein required for colicin V production
MNWLDIVIVVAVVIPTVIGLRIGMIKAALSLAGLIVGVIVAGRYYLPLSERLSFISPASVAEIAAFIIILIGIMIIAAVLARLLKWTASVIMLGWVNHLGGAVFGLVLGAILCGALLAIWVKFLGVTEAITESSLASILVDFFPLVLALLPDEFDAVRPFFQ